MSPHLYSEMSQSSHRLIILSILRKWDQEQLLNFTNLGQHYVFLVKFRFILECCLKLIL